MQNLHPHKIFHAVTLTLNCYIQKYIYGVFECVFIRLDLLLIQTTI